MSKNTHRAVQLAAAAKISKTPTVNQAEEDIDRAVERVYRIYGPDLSVFFRAVQNQLQLERSEKSDRGAADSGG
jgi:hypothetical protein